MTYFEDWYGRVHILPAGEKLGNLHLCNRHGIWRILLTILFGFLNLPYAEISHKSLFFQAFDQCLVLLCPLALFPAHRKIFLLSFAVDALYLSINPTKAERLL